MAESENRLRLGQFIKRRRLELGLKRPQFEADFGVNDGYLSNLERGQVTPSLHTLSVIARGLKVQPGLLANIYSGLDESSSEYNELNSVRLPDLLLENIDDVQDIKEYIEMKADRRLKLQQDKSRSDTSDN